MNLIETNHQINMTSEHSVSSKNWFKSHLNAKCFNMLLKLTVCSYHVTYAFQSESTFYSCLNVNELLAQNRREIWGLSDCNGTRTYNDLVCERTLNHLAKLAKWLKCYLAKWLSVCLRTKWLWVRVPSQSLNVFNMFVVVTVVRSAVILLQCLLQGWCEYTTVMWTQL